MDSLRNSPTTVSSTDGVVHDDVEAVANYRAVSITAIVALVLGLLSPVALIAPVLIVLPAAALFASVLALRGIALSDGVLVGRGLAVAGLVLALCFGSGVLSSQTIHTWLLARQARPWADMFIELVREDKLPAAFELTIPPQQRTSLDKDLRELYATDEKQQVIEEFSLSEVVPILTELGPDDRVEYLGTGESAEYGATRQVTLRYRAAFNNPALGTQPFSLIMEKRIGVGGLPGSWRVFDRRVDPSM